MAKVQEKEKEVVGNLRDDEAPTSLTLTVIDSNGNEWGSLSANEKEFSTGSVGYHANGKVKNPKNGKASYQVNAMFTLVGSKPAK